LDATGNATPITYLGRDGQQYVVIAAGGPAHLRNVGDASRNAADTLIDFSLAGNEREAMNSMPTSEQVRHRTA
jgi:glucose dehydrogenase